MFRHIFGQWIGAFALVCISTGSAFGADSQGYGNLAVGGNIYTSSVTALSIGGAAGLQLSKDWSGGLFGNYSNLGSNGLYNLSVVFLGAEADYWMNQNLHVGARSGVEILSGGGNTNNNFFIGPKAGYDLPIAGNLSIGPEVSYVFKFASQASNNLNVAAVLEYRF